MSNSHRRTAISGVPSSSNIPAQYYHCSFLYYCRFFPTTSSQVFCTTPIIGDYAANCSPRLAAPSYSPHPFPPHWSSSRSVFRSFRREESTFPYAPCTQTKSLHRKRSCPVSCCNPDQTNFKAELDMQVPIF